MENLLGIALNSVFVGNILLAYFLGMCSFAEYSTVYEPNKVGFVGGFVDKVGQDIKYPLFGGGFGTKVATNTWVNTYWKFGTDTSFTTSWAIEVSWYPIGGKAPWGSNNKWALGLLAGPNTDWVTNPDQSIVAYVNAAAGFVGNVDFVENTGIFLFGKYKFQFNDETKYIAGWMAGFGVYTRVRIPGLG